MGNIQISKELFMLLCRYHLLDDTEQAEAVRDGLQAKLDAIQRRSDYSTFSDKQADPQKREEARRRYLESIGMPEDFRW